MVGVTKRRSAWIVLMVLFVGAHAGAAARRLEEIYSETISDFRRQPGSPP